MTSENPSVIIEEETTQENVEVKQGTNHFFGNVLRRSKRLMSGRRKSEKRNSQSIPEQQSLETDNVDAPSTTNKEEQSFDEPSSPRTRKASQTYYGTEKQVLRDGKKIKEIEITGEKPTEPIDMKKQKKLTRRKSIDKEELNVPCRDLGKADHEGWLYKKSGGHGIIPVGWKRFWVVIKLGKLYCYKTSFNIAADYLLNIHEYSVDHASEKKKTFAFQMKPNEEERKQAVFASETEEDVNIWIEVVNKVLSGINISDGQNNLVPDYEDGMKSMNSPKNGKKHRPVSSAFMGGESSETTGLPSGFGTRTSSTSQPRVRKMSGTANPSSVLSVGSMFVTLEENPDPGTPTKEDVQLKDLLYKEVEVETEVPAEEVQQPEFVKPAVDVKENIVVNGDVKQSPTIENEPPKPVVVRDPKDMVAEVAVELEVKDDSKDKKTTSKLFKDLSTEEDAESVIKQLEKEAAAVETPTVEAKEEVAAVEVAPVVKVDEPAAPIVEVTSPDVPVVEVLSAESPAVEPPSVEAPAVEAPVVEAPVVEAPSVEAPAVEAPAVEAPSVQVPAVEASAVEAPVVEAPSVEAPAVEAPSIEVPAVEASAVEAPVVEAPSVEAPVVEAPSIEAPAVEAPAVEAPAVEAPAVEAPAVEAPAVESPAVEAPSVEAPIVEAPVVEASAVEAPIVEAPVVEASAVEAPAVEAPAVEAPAVEAPAVEAPAVETPAVEAPVVESPAVEAPVVESHSVEAPSVEALVVESTVVEAPSVEAPAVEAPSILVSSVEAPSVEAQAVETPAVEAPGVEAPSVEVSSVEAPSVEAPVVEATAVVSKDSDVIITDSEIDLSLTVTGTNVDLGDDLDIPTLNTGNSSLIDDITMELSSQREPSSNLTTQQNGTAVPAV